MVLDSRKCYFRRMLKHGWETNIYQVIFRTIFVSSYKNCLFCKGHECVNPQKVLISSLSFVFCILITATIAVIIIISFNHSLSSSRSPNGRCYHFMIVHMVTAISFVIARLVVILPKLLSQTSSSLPSA